MIDFHLRNPKDRCFSCGQWFQPKESNNYHGGTITCGVACSYDFQRWASQFNKDAEHNAIKTRANRFEKKQVAARRRRRKLMGLDYNRHLTDRFKRFKTKIIERGITWYTIAQRDGMTCQVCNIKCHPPTGKNEPTEATLGHRIPLVLGGDHSW